MTLCLDKDSIQPGQWIIFSHETEELFSSPFKILCLKDITENKMRHRCCFILINALGQIGEYCTRLGIVHGQTLPFDHKVKILTKEQVTIFLGQIQYRKIEFLTQRFCEFPSAKL